MTEAEKAYQYFVIAVPENEEQAKAYFWARKALVVTDSALKNWITGMMSLIFLWNGLNPVSLENRRRERRKTDGD